MQSLAFMGNYKKRHKGNYALVNGSGKELGHAGVVSKHQTRHFMRAVDVW